MDKPTCFGKNYKLVVLFIILMFSCFLLKANESLIEVKIGILESLATKEPSSSDRYRKLYESAIFYALGENENKLKHCGYKLKPAQAYFNLNDYEDMMSCVKKLEDGKVWAMIGPRRGTDFVTIAKNIKNTPIISPMANADEVYLVNRTTFTMYPRIQKLVELVSKEVKKQNYGKRYGVLVDVRCNSCLDFAKQYRQHNADHQQLFSVSAISNQQNWGELKKEILKNKIDYLLLPNYSILTGLVIREVHQLDPKIKFVGSDGWGEDSFTLLEGYGIDHDVEGISIRAGANQSDINDRYQIYSLNRETNKETIVPPNSIFSLVLLIRQLSDDLCEAKPRNKDEYSKYLASKSQDHFKMPEVYSIQHLKDEKLQFSHYVS